MPDDDSDEAGELQSKVSVKTFSTRIPPVSKKPPQSIASTTTAGASDIRIRNHKNTAGMVRKASQNSLR